MRRSALAKLQRHSTPRVRLQAPAPVQGAAHCSPVCCYAQCSSRCPARHLTCTFHLHEWCQQGTTIPVSPALSTLQCRRLPAGRRAARAGHPRIRGGLPRRPRHALAGGAARRGRADGGRALGPPAALPAGLEPGRHPEAGGGVHSQARSCPGPPPACVPPCEPRVWRRCTWARRRPALPRRLAGAEAERVSVPGGGGGPSPAAVEVPGLDTCVLGSPDPRSEVPGGRAWHAVPSSWCTSLTAPSTSAPGTAYS